MRNFFPLWGAFLLVCLYSSCAQHTHRQPTAFDGALWVAIGNQGPYPNYWYNLANEYNNAGEITLAIDAYRRCLDDCQNQAICNDACYNLSLLCFEQQLTDSGYLLMDTLLARQYTWLQWYANQKQLAVFETPAYQKRLMQIKTLVDKRQDPENARFVYEDVDRFVSLFPILQQNWQEAPYLLQTRYFDQGSPALLYYQKFKMQSGPFLFALRLQQRQAYFAQSLPLLRDIRQQEANIRASFHRFDSLYPAAIFPDVYYAVGCFNAGGTSSPQGLIIGAEMYCLQPNSPLANFSSWERAVAAPPQQLPLIVAHELVHMQQKGKYDNLQEQAIFEGMADFVTELVTGSHINRHVHAWVAAEAGREDSVWQVFTQEMEGKNAHRWIGNADRAQNGPADLGYFVGYQLVAAIYRDAADKKEALRLLLESTDYAALYQQSSYRGKR